MADEGTGAEGTATGPDATGQGSAEGKAKPQGSGPGRGHAGRQAGSAAAGQGGSGSRTAVHEGGPAGGQDAGDLSPEAMLAAAVADGSGQDGTDPLEAAKAEIARWKKHARENEQRAKSNADKALQFDAYQESQLTEQQKLAARAEDAERRARDAEGRYHRTLAAATYDLPPSMIDQLGDGTEEEILARAEVLAAAINERAAVLAAAQGRVNGQPPNGAGNGSLRPVESLRPGALPAGETKPKDPNAWVRQMLAGKKQK